MARSTKVHGNGGRSSVKALHPADYRKPAHRDTRGTPAPAVDRDDLAAAMEELRDLCDGHPDRHFFTEAVAALRGRIAQLKGARR